MSLTFPASSYVAPSYVPINSTVNQQDSLVIPLIIPVLNVPCCYRSHSPPVM